MHFMRVMIFPRGGVSIAEDGSIAATARREAFVISEGVPLLTMFGFEKGLGYPIP